MKKILFLIPVMILLVLSSAFKADNYYSKIKLSDFPEAQYEVYEGLLPYYKANPKLDYIGATDLFRKDHPNVSLFSDEFVEALGKELTSNTPFYPGQKITYHNAKQEFAIAINEAVRLRYLNKTDAKEDLNDGLYYTTDYKVAGVLVDKGLDNLSIEEVAFIINAATTDVGDDFLMEEHDLKENNSELYDKVQEASTILIKKYNPYNSYMGKLLNSYII